ncbi:MAG: hypothetical protein ACOY3I_05400 [Verrucomicrobiota bacterium]
MASCDSYCIPSVFSYLNPVIIDDLTRFGNANDGGYLLPASALKAIDWVISFGVCNDWSFEKEIKDTFSNIQVIHAYDHTIGKESFLKSAFVGFAKFILGKGSWKEMTSDFKTFFDYQSFFREPCRHFKKRVYDRLDRDQDITMEQIFSQVPKNARILLKIDIENDEYRILPQVFAFRENIDVLVIEFHNTEPFREVFERHIKQLLSFYEVVHTHANNNAGIAPDGLPETLEITFLRKSLITSEKGLRHTLPLRGLDAPNDPSKPDLSLTF